MRNCEVTKNVVYRCRYKVYQTKNSNQLDQNIDIIWHKHSMLVNDNAECGLWNIMFLKKKRNYHENIYVGGIGIKETF